LAAFCNLAVSFLQLRDGSEVTTAGEYYASHPAVHFRRLGVAPPGL
jgi:hypothetical protein